MMQLDDFWTEGDTGVAILPEPYPCGHTDRTAGCGGCDPGAIEFVRDDGGEWRPVTAEDLDVTIFDRDLGEVVDLSRIPDRAVELIGEGVFDSLVLGVTPINQGRRHVIPKTLTLG